MIKAICAPEQVEPVQVTSASPSSPAEPSDNQSLPGTSSEPSTRATVELLEPDIDRLASALAHLLMMWWRRREEERAAEGKSAADEEVRDDAGVTPSSL